MGINVKGYQGKIYRTCVFVFNSMFLLWISVLFVFSFGSCIVLSFNYEVLTNVGKAKDLIEL